QIAYERGHQIEAAHYQNWCFRSDELTIQYTPHTTEGYVLLIKQHLDTSQDLVEIQAKYPFTSSFYLTLTG
ncbi:TPA: hypothetical protein ACHKZ8_001668, partial [Escherichia coli]